MKLVHNKIDGTFLIGFTFSNHEIRGTKRTNLIFDFGKHSFAFVLRGEY